MTWVEPTTPSELQRALEALAAGGQRAVLRRKQGGALLARLLAARHCLEDPTIVASRHVEKDVLGCVLYLRAEFWAELARMPMHSAMTPEDLRRELKSRLSRRGRGTKFGTASRIQIAA
jgi:hypothetical protein